jgi:hypothetical protein
VRINFIFSIYENEISVEYPYKSSIYNASQCYAVYIPKKRHPMQIMKQRKVSRDPVPELLVWSK